MECVTWTVFFCHSFSMPILVRIFILLASSGLLSSLIARILFHLFMVLLQHRHCKAALDIFSLSVASGVWIRFSNLLSALLTVIQCIHLLQKCPVNAVKSKVIWQHLPSVVISVGFQKNWRKLNLFDIISSQVALNIHLLSFSRFLLMVYAGVFLVVEVKHGLFIGMTACFLSHSKPHICSGCNTGLWASANLIDIPPWAEVLNTSWSIVVLWKVLLSFSAWDCICSV